MLQAFFDDSREDGCVLILAGFAATSQQWMQFCNRWEQALTMSNPRWRTFKMSRVELGDPSQLERSEYHYRIIEEFIPGAFCIAIPLPALAKVTEEFRIEPKFRNPYYLAWLVTISLFRNFHLRNGWTQPINIFFDQQGEAKMVLEAWNIMAKQNADMKAFQTAPIFSDDEKTLPLQAADLLAWWARKNWVEHGTFNNQKWLFPWEERSPGPDYFFAEVDENGIRKHFLKTMILPN